MLLPATVEDATRLVSKLKPGQVIHLEVSYGGGGIGAFVELMTGFSAPDRVMEKISNSSYEFNYYRREFTGQLIFRRMHCELPEGVRGYISPDRREKYGWTQRPDHLWQTRELAWLSIKTQHDLPAADADLIRTNERRILCALHGHSWIPGKTFPPVRPFLCRSPRVDEVITMIACEICERCRTVKQQAGEADG